MSCHIRHNSNAWNTWENASSLKNYIAALLNPSKKYLFVTHTHTPLYTPISIKVASEKNDAWSMLHSLWCSDVKTMYFKTLNHRPFNLRQWFEVRFFSVVICKCCKFSMSLLGPCTWEFFELKKIKFKLFF